MKTAVVGESAALEPRGERLADGVDDIVHLLLHGVRDRRDLDDSSSSARRSAAVCSSIRGVSKIARIASPRRLKSRRSAFFECPIAGLK